MLSQSCVPRPEVLLGATQRLQIDAQMSFMSASANCRARCQSPKNALSLLDISKPIVELETYEHKRFCGIPFSISRCGLEVSLMKQMCDC